MFRVVGFGAVVGIALLVLWAVTIANIIRTPEGAYRAGNQIVWLLVVIFVPFIGVPLYWILGAPQTR
jgi:Phospholipase_D-nuclease N-terminal